MEASLSMAVAAALRKVGFVATEAHAFALVVDIAQDYLVQLAAIAAHFAELNGRQTGTLDDVGAALCSAAVRYRTLAAHLRVATESHTP